MRSPFVPFSGALLIAVFVAVACTAAPTAPSSPTSAPQSTTPTQAVSAPTTTPAVLGATPAAAPTNPTASQKAAFPESGRTITIIVPYPAGGGADVAARLMATGMEKELGVPVQVANRAGAGGQVGFTELVNSPADGYTIATTPLPTTNGTYLPPDRKATYGRKDFQAVALHVVDPGALVVKADSPYKTAREFLDAAKARPEQIRVATGGILSGTHLEALQVQRTADVKFAIVLFDGTAPAQTAVLGGHVDGQFGYLGESLAQVRNGQFRILAVMDNKRSAFLPDVPTMEEQGYAIRVLSARGFGAPAGTPMDRVQILTDAMKKVMEDPEHQRRATEMGVELRYMDPAQFGAYWDQEDRNLAPLVELASQK